METTEQAETTANVSTGEDLDLSSIIPEDMHAQFGISKETTEQPAKDSVGEEVSEEEGEQSLSEEESSEEESEEFEGKDEALDDDEPRFELVHNGEKKTVTLDEMKELAQKGFDYTKKTQSVGEEKKALEQEMQRFKEESEKTIEDLESRYKEIDDVINLKQQWDFFLDNLENTDPDFFSEIQEKFQETSSAYNNPLIKKQLDVFNQKLTEIEKRGQKYENEAILKAYESEKNNFQESMNSTFEALGLKPDWNKVESAWKKGAESVERAFYMVHGPDMVKLWNSKQKLSNTKKVAQRSKAPQVGSVSSKKPAGKAAPDTKGLTYQEMTEAILSGRLDF